MVANPPIERIGPGQMDYLLNRLADIERRMDQQGAKSTFPFSIGHNGVRDFSVEPSASGDGTADVFIGNGAGGKLIRVSTDSLYGTKIYQLLDQNGGTMMSTDALASYGLGTPSYPFVYGGFESLTLAGATTQGTATEIGRGVNWVYNPATYVSPRVRLFSSTAETVKVFAQWRDGQGNLNNTTDQTYALSAGVAALRFPAFGKNWDANDMNTPCSVFVKAYCTTANPGNVNVQLSYTDGYGVSQRWYNDNFGSWAV